MKKLILFLVIAASACQPEKPRKHYAYRIVLPDNISVWPVECDSLRAEGPCATYYVNGRAGRICGNYTAYPQ
jgi:hypothetical protein